MVLWVFAYVQTHQIVHIKYMQFFIYVILVFFFFFKNELVVYEIEVFPRIHWKQTEIGTWTHAKKLSGELLP